MPYNFNTFKDSLKNTEEWLKKECQQIRTSRASPTLLDQVSVESYGSMLSIPQVAGVSVEDPRTIRISPWDMSQVKAIEKALTTSNLGVSVSSDDKGLRVIFPELTTERKGDFVKVVKGKLEDAKVTVRKERDKTWTDIQAKEKEGGMSEDEKFRLKNDMQKLVDETNARLVGIAEKKEKDIMS